jgi:hypothetical protein
LESARWKVIDEGVKSAEDGMVRGLFRCSQHDVLTAVLGSQH